MANTGILLRKNTKANLEIERPQVGEIVFATDTNEIGMLVNNSIHWQEWELNLQAPHILTGSTVPNDSDFLDGDKYIRVWENLGTIEITEYKKENGSWREIQRGVTNRTWLDNNFEPNNHTDVLYPYLGKYTLKMEEGYIPTEDLDILTLGYISSLLTGESFVKLDGSNQMDSGYIAVESGDVITANNLLSGNYEILVPDYNHYYRGGLWNEDGVPRISEGVGTSTRVIHKGNYNDLEGGYELATEGNYLLVGSPDPSGSGQAFRKDFITIFDTTIPNYEDTPGVKILGDLRGTQYGTGFGSTIKTNSGSPIWIAGTDRGTLSGGGIECYDFNGVKQFTINDGASDYQFGVSIDMDANYIATSFNRVIDNKWTGYIGVYDHSGNEVITFGSEFEVDGITPIVRYTWGGWQCLLLHDGIIYKEGTDDNHATQKIFMFNASTGDKVGEIEFPPEYPLLYNNSFVNHMEVKDGRLYTSSDHHALTSDDHRICVFDIQTKQFIKYFKSPADLFVNNAFGEDFKIHGGVMFIGCFSGFNNASENGGVYIYSLDGAYIGSIPEPLPQLNSRFGFSVEVDQNTGFPIIGAPRYDYNSGRTDDGAVFIYD